MSIGRRSILAVSLVAARCAQASPYFALTQARSEQGEMFWFQDLQLAACEAQLMRAMPVIPDVWTNRFQHAWIDTNWRPQ